MDRWLASSLLGSAMAMVGALPVFVVSAVAVLISDELELTGVSFGLAVSIFFACAAIASLVIAPTCDVLGPSRSTVMAGAVATCASCNMAFSTDSFLTLLTGMAALGAANGFLEVAANLSISRSIPVGRQGLAFGIKQSAVPLAILVAGFFGAGTADMLGWRALFLATALMGALIAFAGLRSSARDGRQRTRSSSGDAAPISAIALSAVAMGFGSTAYTAFGAFLPIWAFSTGFSVQQAGLLMGIGGALSIVARVTTGQTADRRGGSNLGRGSRQLLAGAVGLGVIAVGTAPTVVVGAFLAFALGWAWPGLLIFAVVRVGRDRPSAAAAALQSGAFAGGAVGPVAFGGVVAATGFSHAWIIAAVLLVVAAALLILARRLFLADIAKRPLS